MRTIKKEDYFNLKNILNDEIDSKIEAKHKFEDIIINLKVKIFLNLDARGSHQMSGLF